MSRVGLPGGMMMTRHLLRLLGVALGTLTVVRIPVGAVRPEELRASTALFPLTGVLVGLPPALVLAAPLPAVPRATLALVAWVVITGALHVDGWADCCDAAFAPPAGSAGETRIRRLEILKDPRVGVFGTVGVLLLLLTKWSFLVHASPAAPLLAAPVGRWAMVHALGSQPPARSDGFGAAYAGRLPLTRATLLLAGIAGGSVWAAGPSLRPLAAAAVGMAAAALTARFLAMRFGGVTGDIAGAAGEAAELGALAAFVPWLAG
jgi:adenosylcobinamide-GDP ribazoletransferase